MKIDKVFLESLVKCLSYINKCENIKKYWDTPSHYILKQ